MAKNKPESEHEQEIRDAGASVPLTLQEFCIRLSAEDKRVALIGAFEHSERRSKRLKDTAEKYAERYQQFINRPA